MLVHFSSNIFKQAFGVIFHNRGRLLAFLIIHTVVTCQYKYFHQWNMDFIFPVVPISILGGALAIFLAFRNSSAYDRWWEARKIWGGIVNYSRTFAMEVLTFAAPVHSEGAVDEKTIRQWQVRVIHRHIAWLYGLNVSLRSTPHEQNRDQYLEQDDLAYLKGKANIPTQLVFLQGIDLKKAFEAGYIEHFRHMELAGKLEEMYNLQGKAERIKKTVFPYYYNYFTRLFLWVFILMLPFGLVKELSWLTIPMATAISFVFSILEKSGSIHEDPFEGRAADTPVATITRAIEIDLLEMLSQENNPEPLPLEEGRFGVAYFN